MKQPSHLLLYRDGRDQPTLFFGPFVSPTVAQFFKATLPEPLEGGFCRIATVQPYTQQEGHIVHEHLLNMRKERSLIHN